MINKFSLKALQWFHLFIFIVSYDAQNNDTCGDRIIMSFTGKWQVLIPDFKFVNDTRCEVPQGCTNVATKKDAFDILNNK